jgi:hypothetical protein
MNGKNSGSCFDCHAFATGLVAFTGICAVLVIAIPLLAGTGPLPERLIMLLAFAMCGGAVTSYVFIVGRFVWLWCDRRRLYSRRPLTDKEFIASLGSGAAVSPAVVRQVREIAARCYGPLGERFAPEDRLEEDLHWSNISPWATENFFDDLNEWIQPRLLDPQPEFQVPLTFGDVVIEVQRVLIGSGKSPNQSI